MTDLAVYKVDDDGAVTLSLAEMSRVVSGPEAATQLVAHHLFQSRGSCAYNRAEGGGIADFIGSNVTSTSARSDAAISVSKAMTSIMRSQSQNGPADETVTGLQLLDVIVSGDVVSIAIRIDLLDGNSFKSSFRSPGT